MKQIILASSSPRRKDILSATGLSFKVVASDYEENYELELSPHELVRHLALGKARDVATRYIDHLVIGADTLVCVENGVMGKPKDREELVAALKEFSGGSHTVLSGISIVENDHVIIDSVETRVYFRKLTDSEIQRYADTEEWKDKAGGYGIQATGALFIEKIVGDYLNVVGLPLCRLSERLLEFDVDLMGISLSKKG